MLTVASQPEVAKRIMGVLEVAISVRKASRFSGMKFSTFIPMRT
jgi:hypothetical protein